MGFLSIALLAHCNHPLSQQLGLTLRELKNGKLIKTKAKEATKTGRGEAARSQGNLSTGGHGQRMPSGGLVRTLQQRPAVKAHPF